MANLPRLNAIASSSGSLACNGALILTALGSNRAGTLRCIVEVQTNIVAAGAELGREITTCRLARSQRTDSLSPPAVSMKVASLIPGRER